MVSRTPSMFCLKSEFQNLKTCYPNVSKFRCRSTSAAICKSDECVSPSTSMISLISRQTKSAKYGPIGSCLTNLNPSICLFLSLRDSNISAATFASRRTRERLVVQGCDPLISTLAQAAAPHPSPLPVKCKTGRGKRVTSDLHSQCLGDGKEILVATATKIHHQQIVFRQRRRELHDMRKRVTWL